MGFFDRLKGQPEERGSVENPQVPISSSDFMRVMGWGDLISSSGITVGIDNALGVPAVWAAVNFMSGTLAGLTMEVYQRTPEGSQESHCQHLQQIKFQ
jgi:phage portal protein BeeE